MYRENTRHLQKPLFSDLNALPEKLRIQLEESWAGTFYHDVFVHIDEDLFAVLYSDEPSRSNTPINILTGPDWLKSAFGWSDEEMYHLAHLLGEFAVEPSGEVYLHERRNFDFGAAQPGQVQPLLGGPTCALGCNEMFL
jgi:hypothetical protein